MNRKIILFFLGIVIITSPGLSQQNRNRNKGREQQTQRLFKNRTLTEIDSIVWGMEDYFNKKKQEDRLKELQEMAGAFGDQKKVEVLDLNKKFFSGARKQQGLNPNISLGGDFFIGGSTSDDAFINTPGDKSYGNNGIFLRELELGLESPLDPYSRGKAFISISEGGIAIEEAYIEMLNLPLGLNLRLGIVNPEFGPLNRYHDHALPQFDRPRALVNYFGNGNFGGPGVAGNFLLPRLLGADATSLEIAAVHGSAPEVFASGSPWNIQGVGHFKSFYDIGKNTFFEFSLNSMVGQNPNSIVGNESYLSTVNSLGLVLKWVPAGRAKYRTFDWKSEIFYATYQMSDYLITSKSFYSSIQNKLSARWWISGRVVMSEPLSQDDQYEWDYTLALDFWQSEFVFLRLQYQYNNRFLFTMAPEIFEIPSDHSLLLQICWAMGPHKHEAY